MRIGSLVGSLEGPNEVEYRRLLVTSKLKTQVTTSYWVCVVRRSGRAQRFMYIELIKCSKQLNERSNCSKSHEGASGLRSNCAAHPIKPTTRLHKPPQMAAWPRSPLLGFLAGILPSGPLRCLLSIPELFRDAPTLHPPHTIEFSFRTLFQPRP